MSILQKEIQDMKIENKFLTKRIQICTLLITMMKIIMNLKQLLKITIVHSTIKTIQINTIFLLKSNKLILLNTLT